MDCLGASDGAVCVGRKATAGPAGAATARLLLPAPPAEAAAPLLPRQLTPLPVTATGPAKERTAGAGAGAGAAEAGFCHLVCVPAPAVLEARAAAEGAVTDGAAVVCLATAVKPVKP